LLLIYQVIPDFLVAMMGALWRDGQARDFEEPLALAFPLWRSGRARRVKGRERIYPDRFWNAFSADPKQVDAAWRRHYAQFYALPVRCILASSNATPSIKMPSTTGAVIPDSGHRLMRSAT